MTTEEELVRAVWDRWNGGVRTLGTDLLDPELEVHSALTGSAFHGEAGLQEWASEIDEQFEQWEVTVAETEAVRSGLLLVHGEIRARGRGSGMDIDEPASWVVAIRGGRVSEIHNFIGADAAAAASEKAAS